MFVVIVALLGLLVASALITAFVAYVDRGQSIPHAPRLTDAMIKARRKYDAFLDPDGDDRTTADDGRSDTLV